MRGRWMSIVAVLALAAAAAAQPTALTYQGRLKNGGQPASGLHDFRFRLFDAAQGGNQLGDIQCVNNITVADGLFTASIDFGQQFASTDGRFLEIQVREDTGLNCNNANGFVTLAPRQLLSAAPLASHANSAFALDAADGSPLAAVVVDNSGRVGIGTGTPEATVHLLANQGGDTPGEGIRIQGTAGGADNVSYMSFVNAAGARTGYIGDGGGADNNIFLTSDFGDVLLYNSNIGAVLAAKAGGDVGIGTTDPLAKLDVRGDIRFGASAELRPSASVEKLRMVRGTIASDGSKIVGDGFSSQRTAKGTYLITFTTPFTQTPSITASADLSVNEGFQIALPDNVTSSKSEVHIFHFDLGHYDRAFHFIAVGPR